MPHGASSSLSMGSFDPSNKLAAPRPAPTIQVLRDLVSRLDPVAA